VNPGHLLEYGFDRVGGAPFTLDDGLRPHILKHVKKLKHDYDAVYRAFPPEEQQLVQAVAAKYPSSAGEWDVEQELEDPKDLVEVS
jgi:hypothetical protein